MDRTYLQKVCGAVILAMLICSSGTEGVDNAITRWNLVAQLIVRKLGLPTQIGARTYALVHVAQYKALQLAYKMDNPHPEAVATYAAHYVLSELFPAQQSPILDLFIATQIYPFNLSVAEDAAVQKIAFKYAIKLLEDRAHDGSQIWAKFKPAPPGSPPGEYQFTPNQTFIAFPQLAKAKRFVIPPAPTFDIYGGPYKVPSKEFDGDYEVMATVGNVNSPVQTQFQRDTAHFWENAGNTSGLVGLLYNATLAIIGSKPLNLKETSKLFALLGVAGYDAPIAAWYFKHHYLFWRPVTAFLQGDPHHKPDPYWKGLLAVPPEPEYVSGHATNGGSWAGALGTYLKLELGAELQPFTVATTGYFLPDRVYHSIDEIALEVSVSRIYGGLHFPKAAHDGRLLGIAVGTYVAKHFDKVFGTL